MSNATTLKEEITKYISENKIADNISKAVNELTKTRPQNKDAWTFLADYFTELAIGDVGSHSPCISHLKAREIFDSRGNPTVQVDVYAHIRQKQVLLGRGNAPSGASCGTNEAYEMRDGKGDKKSDRLNGKGVLDAVKNVEEIKKAVGQQEPKIRVHEQKRFDKLLKDTDNTDNYKSLGGNLVTAASFACAQAYSSWSKKGLYLHFAKLHWTEKEQPKFTLPIPMCNVINGGKHATSPLQIQEFMIVPVGPKTFKEKLEACVNVYQKLKKTLKETLGTNLVGDEGGFAPADIKTAEQALETLRKAVKDCGYNKTDDQHDIKFAIDAAANEFYKVPDQKANEEEKAAEGGSKEAGKEQADDAAGKKGQEQDKDKKYLIQKEPEKWMSSEELVDYYLKLKDSFKELMSIEDGMAENDHKGWQLLTAKMKEKDDKMMIVGDDLYTTNTKTIETGIKEKWANALLLKVNQIGTISQAMDAAKLIQKEKDMEVIVSHRSGETTSTVIADLAVGIGAKYIKTGAPCRGERVCKYNRLLQISEELELSSK